MTPPDPFDAFEQRLAAIRRRELPPEWRARILAAAGPRERRNFPAFRLFSLRSVFSFPHPIAWGAVAACWVAIAVLNFTGPCGEALYAVTPKDFKGRLPSAREYLVQMEWQRRLLAALAADDLEPRPIHRLRRQDL